MSSPGPFVRGEAIASGGHFLVARCEQRLGGFAPPRRQLALGVLAPGVPGDVAGDVWQAEDVSLCAPRAVGDLARVDVYVPGDQVEEASIVLLASEVDEVDDRFDDDRPPPASRIRPSGRVVAALILFVLIAGPVAQVLRWY